MRVALIHDSLLPAATYGGTERVIWWLAKALSSLGLGITLVARRGTSCDFARVVDFSDSEARRAAFEQADVLHFFHTPSSPPEKPYLVTIGGNGQAGETFLTNTVFVSSNHARRHGARAFVHNGIDPDEYIYSEKSDGPLLFLAKASWNVKNVRGAMRLARRAGLPLDIVGGGLSGWPRWRGVRWRGLLGGRAKARAIADCRALLFPVLWNEPFGLAIIESLVSGLPVIATPFGSLPELVTPETGALCETEDQFLGALENLDRFSSRACRARVMDTFTHFHMARGYLDCYERVLAGEPLNPSVPRAPSVIPGLASLRRREGARQPHDLALHSALSNSDC